MILLLVKNALGISAASIAGQFAFLLATPILTRIFSPSDFGLWAIYVSLTFSIGSIASGRLELAMLSRKLKGGHRVLLYSSVVICLFFSLSCLFAASLLISTFESYEFIKSNSLLIFLVPVGIFIVGLGQI